MLSLGSLFVLLAAAAAGVSQTLNVTGVDANGYYYSFLAPDGDVNVTMSNYGSYPTGFYTVQWSSNSVFLGGKGWLNGTDQNIQFSTDHSQNPGNSLLSYYGWATDPLVEYRIVEDYPASDRFDGLALKGTVVSDGAVYSIYEAPRVNEPSIQGIANFTQYWSVAQRTRSGGVLTTGNHFTAWAALGMPLGALNYQFLSVENSSGAGGIVHVAISRCVAEYGQCGGQNFIGPTAELHFCFSELNF
ncbi:endo-1,4-beta-xylanase B precursor [Mycena vulgaris]|nr:endo-1,4-beta-xylanase B precursor [Mycena vulgaris]